MQHGKVILISWNVDLQILGIVFNGSFDYRYRDTSKYAGTVILSLVGYLFLFP